MKSSCIAENQTEIRTRHIPNTYPEHYCYTNLAGAAALQWVSGNWNNVGLIGFG
jgi:hypothetical protein